MNYGCPHFEDVTINGQQMFYIADDDGNCIFNKGNILYGYSINDVFDKYQKLDNKDKDPVYRKDLNVRLEIIIAQSFEKEIETRDASKRILRELDLLSKYNPDKAEWLESVQKSFETIQKEAEDVISKTKILKQNLNESLN